MIEKNKSNSMFCIGDIPNTSWLRRCGRIKGNHKQGRWNKKENELANLIIHLIEYSPKSLNNPKYIIFYLYIYI